MSGSFDVLIVGGGIVGLTAALAMAQRNFTVAVIDGGAFIADTTQADLRVYAMNHASQSLLQHLNVWQQLEEERLSPYNQMHVWDSFSGAAIDFDSRIIAAAHLGTIVEESVLKKALLKQVTAQTNINLFSHNLIDDVIPLEQGMSVCSQARCWQGRLLMVADGGNSPTRQKLNVPVTHWSYKQEALVATVSTEIPHQRTAFQVFHPEGPLAFLPLVNPHHCSIVWSTKPARAKQLIALNQEAFNCALAEAFSTRLGEVTLLSKRHHFPLHMRHVTRYTGTRWMLLGDAAHTIHPLAGLGLNVGLTDVATWLKCMDEHKGELVSLRQLSAYQRERKNAVWQTIGLMEGLHQLFTSTSTPLGILRGIGLHACNRLPLLKRLFIQQARG